MVKQSRFWQVALICLVAVMLAGCGNRSMNKSTPFTAADPEGMIVVGVVRTAGHGGPIMIGRFDPATGKISGLTMLPGNTLKVNADGMMLNVTERFYAFRTPPGEYAIAQFQSVGGGFGPPTINNTWLIDRETMTVRNNTPIFTAKPGELTYIGDLIINYAQFPAGVTIGADPAAMQKFLGEFSGVNAGAPKFAPVRSNKP
ncbi:hypothetical protein FNB15_10555 [Ferrovibrio terrae]|uniref:Uncharacterized protein n=1 Tax=Ferrovibrio terrae TaxID=2594003 RepID=A0A516H1P2_9PROT|nr:hypothetical protein [Ferrovibrio terrae]QDO97684.1 hypothetical protein FNB15_10555 [Ferrovibrio terrae]